MSRREIACRKKVSRTEEWREGWGKAETGKKRKHKIEDNGDLEVNGVGRRTRRGRKRGNRIRM